MTVKLVRMKRLVPVIMILLFLISGCARKSYLNVNYLLPLSSQDIAGKTVFLEVKDQRPDPNIFSDTVQSDFEFFTGLFSLTVENPSSEKTLLGAYDLRSLFKEAFQKRLESMGITTVDVNQQSIPEFTVTLKHFLVDLQGRQWIANVSYEASLTKDNQIIARETVNGSAERLKFVGKKDAEKVVSSIFTEIVNKLSIERLFEQAQI